MPQPRILFLEGLDAQALIDALIAYGPSRMGNHTLHAALLHRLTNEREYKYERLPEFSRGLAEDIAEANRHLTALFQLFHEDGRMAEAGEHATPLLEEIEKIVDALDESNGTDPQTVADPEADELGRE